MRFFRLIKILNVAFRFGLEEFFPGRVWARILRTLVRPATFWRRLERPRAERLRLALEALGPIFIKFGQMLSTRRDLLPNDIDQNRPLFLGTQDNWLESVWNVTTILFH